jgi:hypothetical protein
MKVALEYGLLPVLRFSSVSIIPPILNKEFFSLSSAGEEWMKNSRVAERLICALLWVIVCNVVSLLIRSVSIPGETTIFL